MMKKNKSPCLTCTRVKDPKNCQNKSCSIWQEWFLKRWAAMQERLGITPQAGREAEDGT